MKRICVITMLDSKYEITNRVYSSPERAMSWLQMQKLSELKLMYEGVEGKTIVGEPTTPILRGLKNGLTVRGRVNDVYFQLERLDVNPLDDMPYGIY